MIYSKLVLTYDLAIVGDDVKLRVRFSYDIILEIV